MYLLEINEKKSVYDGFVDRLNNSLEIEYNTFSRPDIDTISNPYQLHHKLNRFKCSS